MSWHWLAAGYLAAYFMSLAAAGFAAAGEMPFRHWLKFMAYHAAVMAWLWPIWLALYLSAES